MTTPHYFIFKGVNSRDMGVQVESYPPIMRAPKRVKQVNVPGRAGALILSEGDAVYDAYTRRMKIAIRNDDTLDDVLAWLSGEGPFVSGNEPERVYQVAMQQAFTADKLYHGVYHGELQMLTQPFKGIFPELALSIAATRTLHNPGSVPSLPMVVCTGSGSRSITIEDVTFQIASNAPATVTIDCEACMITGGGRSLEDCVTMLAGEFPSFPVGECSICREGTFTSVQLMPRWRWL